jgi:hypothetical protein
VGATAAAGLAESARSPGEAARGIVWTFVRVLPFLGALIVIYLAALVGLLSKPEFPFDPANLGLGRGGTIAVVLAILAYGTCAFFLRPLAPPPPRAAATATSAALLVASLATLAVLGKNPYLGLLLAIGLQFWLLAAARLAGGKAAAAGLVIVGTVPVMLAVGDLAGRFDAGLGVWQDLLSMFTGGQVSGLLVLLGCVLAGVGVALVAAAGRGPAPPAPEMSISASRAEQQPEPAEPEPEPEPAQPEPEPEPAEPEPDSRLWSKPRGSSSSPPGRRSAIPSPSVA